MDDLAHVTDSLRTETQSHYARVEALPFFKALATRELPRDSYVGLLQALEIVYAAFEQAVRQSTNPVLTAARDAHRRTLSLIRRDQAFFANRALEGSSHAVLHALILEQQIRERARQDPVSLLGYLYVLEGATLGGVMSRSFVARALHLRGADGLIYLSGYKLWTRAQWSQFARRLAESAAGPAELDRVVEAAREVFTGIEEIIRTLYPVAVHSPHDLVPTLNPEAGSHPIPDDVREIRAALLAGERSWQRFPYYEWRYGARGRRFTRSDSAWIVTLTNHRQAAVDQQVAWLGRLLASRGMPQWMLELHLEVLYQELVAAVPEKQATYAKLLLAAAMLHDIRRAQIDDAVFQSLASEFDALVGPDWSTRLPRTGGLLAAAVADELGGIPQAVSSLETWMTDASRFPETWIAAVQTMLRKAREQARLGK
jgi:heme oxygenase